MAAFCKWTLLVVCVLAGLVDGYRRPARAEENQTAKSDLAQYYGFEPLEIYKLNKRSRNLLPADLNHDGRTDLIIVDNGNSRLDLLLQRDGEQVAEQPAPGESLANFIGSDGRLQHKKVTLDKVVSALTTGDFNGDGRTDLAYFGGRDQLIVRYQGEDGNWQSMRRLRLPEVTPASWSTAAGDLNGDGKDDIAVLGKKETYLIYQQPDGKLAAPQTVMNTSGKLGLVRITDLDGDGRADLSYQSQEGDDRPFCVRFQDQQGRLGPEYRFEIEMPRASTLYNLDGKPGDEILTIENRTGRVKVHQVVRSQPQESDLTGQMIYYGFGSGSSSRDTDMGIGDVNGDGLKDVVVTDPGSAQIVVFRQHPKTGLDQGQTFPSLTDAQQVRVGNLDGDPKGDEVVVLSEKEKAIGYSRMAHGRLSFPIVLPLEDEPMAIELADLNGNGREELVCISRSGRSKYRLHAMSLEKDGQWSPQHWGQSDMHDIELTFKNQPKQLMKLDANGDGRIDFLVFAGSEPELLLTNDKGVPEPLENRRGLGLGKVAAGAVFASTGQNPILLVAQQNFARQMKINEEQQWQVVDQFNAAESSAKIVGAAPINLDDTPGDEVVLVDTGVKKLRLLNKVDNLFRPWREVEIGDFRYLSTHVADLNGDGRDDLLLFGSGRFGVLYAGQTDPQLKEVASYETELDKARFADLIAGDLNGDGFVDIACLDTKSQLVEVLDFAPETGLRHAFYFKVFEEKSLNASEQTGTNPREAAIADVTGDGLNDLILLSHDRVLVYPQDPGK
ncbi:VCBS repeat-containing protein [Symmachiella dynata]|uniref:FG-GAP repeat domain-containing protein n=1 Tax=Symmachiella dynata TaxID=2527995 RepID=UPI0030EF28ED